MFPKKLVIIVFASLVILGCSEQSSVELMDNAKQAIAEKKYKEAEVLLKGVVSSNLSNPSANLQLANVYYFQGEFANAIKQYRKIEEHTLIDAESLRFWLQSLLFSENFSGLEDVLTDYSDIVSPSVYQYYSYKILPYQGNLSVGEVPSEKGALEGLNRCIFGGKYMQNEVADCLKLLLPSTEPEVLYEVMKSSIRHNDSDSFLSSIGFLSAAFPESELFQIIHSEALVRNRLYEGASNVIKPLIEKYPNHALLNYLSAVISFEQKNFAESKKKSEKALQNGLKSKPVRLIAAMSAFSLRDFEQAYKQFEIVADEISSSSPEYRVYISTLLALGYASEAAEAIRTIDSVSADDLPLVSSTANVLASIKSEHQAMSLLELFDEILDGESDSYVQLNLQKLALDDLSALTNLESLNENQNNIAVKVGLASYYLSNNDFSKASEMATEISKVEGKEYTSKVIEALIAFRSNSPDTLKKFENLLKLDEYSIPGLFFFINYYIAAEEWLSAKKASNKLLQVIPNSPLAISKHVKILTETEERQLLLSFLSQVHKSNPDNANLASLYAAELLKGGEVSKALNILERYPVTVNNKPLFWVTLINATSLNGDIEGAKNISRKWLSLVPHYKPAILLAANVHEKFGEINTSIDILKKGSRQYAGDSEIKLLLASNYLNIGQISSAKKELRELGPDVKATLPYLFVKGQIALEEGKFEDARYMLGRYYDKHKSYDAFVLLVEALRELRETSEAISVAESYLYENQNDERVTLFLAELYIQTNHKKAIALYEKLVEKGKTEAFLLNNLAWLYHVNGNSEKGLEYAQSAVNKESNNADYLDTLGMIQLRLGNLSKSAELLNSSFELAPKNVLIALHYAEALVAIGNKERAEIILAPYMQRSDELDREIERLLNSKY